MTQHTGKRYIIFGSDGDIGRTTSELLDELGAKLIRVGGPHAPEPTASNPQQKPRRLSIDATCSAQVKDAFDTATRELGDLDGVVHCIGSFGLEPIAHVTDETIDSVLAVNLLTAIYIAREIARRYKHMAEFSVVFVTSAAAQRGMPSQEVLSAAKGGVEALLRSLASTLAPRGRVNGVAPGLITTSLTQPLRSEPEHLDLSKEMFPTRRFGDSKQIADTVAFLLNPEHSFITGQVWCVDGGLTTVQVKPKDRVDASGARADSREPDTSDALHQQLEDQVRFAERTTT